MNYTFHNRGSIVSFNPNKRMFENGGITMLDYHMELVRDAGRRDVFILDHKGREVGAPLYAKVA